ncbi:MAG: hypothetical protein V7K14_15435 [Nostoc sp.]
MSKSKSPMHYLITNYELVLTCTERRRSIAAVGVASRREVLQII